ncbi:MAG: ribonuclease HIII [Parachlamydiales bacterium]|nr:ribonuclease HIII [Parachlamydiales bacterium]
MTVKKNNCFSTSIDMSLAAKLRKDLESQGFTLSSPPYTLFSAQKQGVVCTLYRSGKLTVQGKNKGEFIQFYLEPEILQSFHYTHPESYIDTTPHIGSDEAGKGDFFGPLCVAALYADSDGIKNLLQLGVQDSKRLSDSSVIKMAQSLKKSYSFSIVRLFPEKYNQLYLQFKNLNSLLSWAHTTVIEELYRKTGCKNVLVDQFAQENLLASFIARKKIPIALQQKVRGEEDLVVAAASILARASFIDGLEQLSQQYMVPLLKGASDKVIEQGKLLVAKMGPEILEKIGKIHFKTTLDINNS